MATWHKKTQEEIQKQTEKCNRLLSELKWEFGNEYHIKIKNTAKLLEQQRNYKTVNKKMVSELEKKIIYFIEYVNSQKRIP